MCKALTVPSYLQQHADDLEAAVRRVDVPWSVMFGAARYLADQMTPEWEPVKPPVVESLQNQDGCMILTYRSGGLTILAIRNFGETAWDLMATSFGYTAVLRVSQDENQQWNWRKRI